MVGKRRTSIRVGVIGTRVDRSQLANAGQAVYDDGNQDGSAYISTAILRQLLVDLGQTAASITFIVASPLRYGIAPQREIVRAIHWLSARDVELIVLAFERVLEIPSPLVERLRALDSEIRWASTSAEVEEVAREVRDRLEAPTAEPFQDREGP